MSCLQTCHRPDLPLTQRFASRDAATAAGAASSAVTELERFSPSNSYSFTCDAAASCDPMQLMGRIHEFQSACCDNPDDVCDAGGMPAQCTSACASSFLEFYSDCALTSKYTSNLHLLVISRSFLRDCL